MEGGTCVYCLPTEQEFPEHTPLPHPLYIQQSYQLLEGFFSHYQSRCELFFCFSSPDNLRIFSSDFCIFVAPKNVNFSLFLLFLFLLNEYIIYSV
ncbi:hypothetical protein XELAEV_18015067mg [Xenopus laevis]|uniref:Uncharacterized protein n=1 Tax=Xenopus laevis TaxID=8355 RepID=A0A974DIZ4_XENLA|nr:hypothetical protein XELAEV_18015067mg [Xenopus laevis]